jgi:hypothetical protein
MTGPAMSQPEADALPCRRGDVELRVEGTRTLLLSDQQDAAFELDPLGRAIWELCDGATTLDEIVGAVCQVFEVDDEVAARDVASLVTRLHRAGLVNRAW